MKGLWIRNNVFLLLSAPYSDIKKNKKSSIEINSASKGCFPFQDSFSIKLNSRCNSLSNQHLKIAKYFVFYHPLHLLLYSTINHHKQEMVFILNHYRWFFYKSFKVQQYKSSQKNRTSTMKLSSAYKTVPLNRQAFLSSGPRKLSARGVLTTR